jgi:hypothetical protein
VKGSAFLGCTIYIYRNELTVPMKLLRRIRFIYQIDDYSLPFLETQQWPGKLAVIRRYRDDLVRRDLYGRRGDADGVIGLL